MSLLQRFRALYGAGIGQPVVLAIGFALFGYVLSVVGVTTLWNPVTWWHSIAVWFLGAVILHDLILFPLYAGVDSVLGRLVTSRRTRSSRPVPRRRGRVVAAAPPVINYVRLPLLASALTFLLFLPGIISQGAQSYRAATGMDQSPFLLRWVLLAVGLHVFSLAVFIVTTVIRSRSSNASGAGQTGSESAANHS